jgi:transposase
LKALVVKRFRNIPSDRQLYRRLWSDPELRELCDIEEHEKPYHPFQITRFRQRIGPERLERTMEDLVDRLRDSGFVKGKIVVCDATFIQAYSKRDPKDDSKGCSDPDARVGRAEKSYRLQS